MRIEPVHGDHSIDEVIFQLEFDEPWTPSDLQKLERLVPQLRNELPAFRRLEQPATVDPTALSSVSAPRAIVGVEFAALRRDGTYEWRFQCLFNTATVNCLSYTRWTKIANVARRYFGAAIAATGDRNIRAFLLQYIDRFLVLDANSRPEWSELFNFESMHLPRDFKERGAIWHLHQGWYLDLPGEVAPGRTLDLKGKLLERLHLDSGRRSLPGTSDSEYFVRIDHFQRCELEEPIRAHVFLDDQNVVTRGFDTLHDINKYRLDVLLSTSAKQRIGLHDSS